MHLIPYSNNLQKAIISPDNKCIQFAQRSCLHYSHLQGTELYVIKSNFMVFPAKLLLTSYSHVHLGSGSDHMCLHIVLIEPTTSWGTSIQWIPDFRDDKLLSSSGALQGAAPSTFPALLPYGEFPAQHTGSVLVRILTLDIDFMDLELQLWTLDSEILEFNVNGYLSPCGYELYIEVRCSLFFSNFCSNSDIWCNRCIKSMKFVRPSVATSDVNELLFSVNMISENYICSAQYRKSPRVEVVRLSSSTHP